MEILKISAEAGSWVKKITIPYSRRKYAGAECGNLKNGATILPARPFLWVNESGGRD
jgi:hypothetical protein